MVIPWYVGITRSVHQKYSNIILTKSQQVKVTQLRL